jgi:hypothetical protein
MIPPRPWKQPAFVLGALVLAGYAVIARGVGNLYPFSTFSMYSSVHTTTGSRIVARDARGRLRELADYDQWRCEAGVDAMTEPRACAPGGEVYGIGYLDREAREYLAAHASASAAPGSEPVEVVRRVWRFGGAPGSPATVDCTIIRCEAVRR